MKKGTLLLMVLLSSYLLQARQKAAVDTGFIMPVEDVFTITGRGTVVTGKVERGIVRVGDTVSIAGLSSTMLKARVTGVEAFRKMLSEAKTGDNVGLLLSGIQKTDVRRGMTLVQPGTAKAYTNFTCKLQLYKKEDGGRSTPVFDKYRPQFIFFTAAISGEISLSPGTNSLEPGQEALVTVKLQEPAVLLDKMEFVIREGGRTVGKGKIVERQ